MSKFKIGKVVSFGWERVKKKWKFLVIAQIVSLAVMGLTQGMLVLVPEGQVGLVVGLTIVGTLVSMVVQVGWLGVALRIAAKKKVVYKDFIPQASVVWMVFLMGLTVGIGMFLAWLLAGGVVITLGLLTAGLFKDMAWMWLGLVVAILALVAATVFVSVRIRLAQWVIVDRQIGPLEALVLSWKMTRGHVWKLIGLGLLLVLINALGAILLLVGLLVTIPLSLIVEARVYRELGS